MKLNTNQLAFIALVKAGLWGGEVHLSCHGKLDYREIYKYACEQTVVGLVAAGLEQTIDLKVPKDIGLLFAARTLELEQRCVLMNQFIASTIEKLRQNDIYTILLKGQGVAECYDKPLWRTSGDVDLFLSKDNYKKARVFLSQIASVVDDENLQSLHLAMTINSWEVELHGTLRCGLWKSMDQGLDEIQNSIFFDGRVRSWMNGNTQVFLPDANEDVVYVFAHILQHFYKGGVGLRQICDWCRLLWTYKGSINIELLKHRLFDMGIENEWKAFANLAVEILGTPAEVMPLYSDSKYYKRCSRYIMNYILLKGNFGCNESYYSKANFILLRKVKTMHRIFKNSFQHIRLFPRNSLKSFLYQVYCGIKKNMKLRFDN